MRHPTDAITEFEVETRVGRALFRALERDSDGAIDYDAEALADAGLTLTRAAEKLFGLVGDQA